MKIVYSKGSFHNITKQVIAINLGHKALTRRAILLLDKVFLIQKVAVYEMSNISEFTSIYNIKNRNSLRNMNSLVHHKLMAIMLRDKASLQDTSKLSNSRFIIHMV